MTQAEALGSAQHRGPSLLIVALTFTLLFAASIVAPVVMGHGEHYPSPYQAIELSSLYFKMHTDALRVSSFLQFGAAIPLGIFTATVVSRLRFLGLTVAGLDIALFGGFTAAAMAALSGLLNWAISWPDIAASGSVHPLHVAAFALGGPGYVVPFGLLVAGVSVAGGLSKRLPRWLMWFGLLIAALAELSAFSLVLYAASFLLPAARVLGFAWMICVGAVLPKRK